MMLPEFAHRNFLLLFEWTGVSEVQQILKFFVGFLVLHFHQVVNQHLFIYLCVFGYPYFILAVFLHHYLLKLLEKQLVLHYPFALRILCDHFFHLVEFACYPGRHRALPYWVVNCCDFVQNYLKFRNQIYIEAHIRNISQTICWQE